MRISQLSIRNLRRHRDLCLELAPGLTVIRGPNEAGKSTVQRALELALFKKATSADQELSAIRSWGAARDAFPAVQIQFELDGTTGSLAKEFAGGRGRVELRLGSERITDPAEVERRIAEMTGIPSEKFFRSTASVRHQELALLDRDEAALRDRLHQSISGATGGTAEARRRLELAVRRYRSEGIKSPGIIKAARAEVAGLESQGREGESRLDRLARDRESLSLARERRAEAESQLRVDAELLARSERAVELKRASMTAQERYERYRRATELRDQIAEKERTHPSAMALTILRPAVERLREMERRISALRAGLAAEADFGNHDVTISRVTWKPLLVAAVVLTMFGLLMGLVLAGPAGAALVGALAVMALALPLTLSSARLRRQALDARERQLLREQQLAQRERDRSTLEQQLRWTERTRDAELGRIGLPDQSAAEGLLAAETEAVAAIEQLRAEYRGLIGREEPTEDVAVLRDRAAAEADQGRHALAGMGEIGAGPEHHRARYAAAVEADRLARERAVADEAAALARLEADPVDAERVAALVEGLAAARDRLAAHQRRLRILQITLDALDEAEQATMKKAARFLEQHMNHDVARITGGRYGRVSVDENALSFRVWAPECADWVDLTELSQGTLDQFYLAARLGLVRQVTRDRRPPLLFDDPFVTFDDDRARRGLELLRELAADHQVIYLTSSSRYDGVADKLIVLPGPTEIDPGPLPAGRTKVPFRSGDIPR